MATFCFEVLDFISPSPISSLPPDLPTTSSLPSCYPVPTSVLPSPPLPSPLTLLGYAGVGMWGMADPYPTGPPPRISSW